jgi:hypothetical protein
MALDTTLSQPVLECGKKELPIPTAMVAGQVGLQGKGDIVATRAAISVLQKRWADREDEWRLLAAKAQAWLARELARLTPADLRRLLERALTALLQVASRLMWLSGEPLPFARGEVRQHPAALTSPFVPGRAHPTAGPPAATGTPGIRERHGASQLVICDRLDQGYILSRTQGLKRSGLLPHPRLWA